MRGGQHLPIQVVFIILGASLTVVFSQHVCFIGSVYSNDEGSFRWVLPYKDPCVCTAIRLGGHLTYEPASGHYFERPIRTVNSEEIQKLFNCSGQEVRCVSPIPLGVEHRTPLPIQDDDFTASSVDAEGGYTSSLAAARLNFGGWPKDTYGNGGISGGWKPDDNYGAWIQVNLGRNVIVSGIITQGRDTSGDGSDKTHWVTKYEVMYTSEGNPNLLKVMSQDGQAQIFTGNDGTGNNQVTNSFHSPVMANSVRIMCTKYNGAVVLRFELLGCLE